MTHAALSWLGRCVLVASMAWAGGAYAQGGSPAVPPGSPEAADIPDPFAPPPASLGTPKAGDRVVLPALTLLDGRTLPAGYGSGQALIIYYWASWCPFCARQSPYVQRLHDEWKDKGGLTVLTVSIDRKVQDARDYVAKRGYTFDVVHETPELRALMGKRRVIPKVFVIDGQGVVQEVIPGEMFEEDVIDLGQYAQPSSGQ